MQRLKKKENIFMLMLIFFSAALFVKSYGQGMSVTNTTALAVSYRNGYAENALLGTICQIIFSFLGIARPDYAHVILFAQCFTIIQYIIVFLFFYFLLKKVEKKYLDIMGLLLIFYSIFLIPYFCGYDQLGAAAPCMLTVTLLGAMSFLRGKWNPLLYVLPIMGMLLQIEFFFAYSGVYFALLIYMWAQTRGVQRKSWQKRLIISFVLLCIVTGVLVGARILSYPDTAMTKQLATQFSIDSTFDEELLNRLQEGYRFGGAMNPHGGNFLELIFFICLFSPYLILGGRLFRNISRLAQKDGQRKMYHILLLGGVMVCPLFLIRCHYGNWIFAFISYYAVIFLVLLAKGDRIVTVAISEMMHTISEKHGWMVLLLLYPIMFVPFSDMNICGITRNVAEDLKYALQVLGIM